MNKRFRSAEVFLVLSMLVVAARAQSGPVCNVNFDTVPPRCPTSNGWSANVTCEHKTITCPTTGGVTLNPLGITYGYKTPSSGAKGTIVLFANSGGTMPTAFPGSETAFGDYYYSQGYQIVETGWDSDWEDTGTTTKNIAYAAGRAAAFLRWVRYGSTTGGSGLWGSGGMCVHATSAGAGATAFALSWYGATYLDKVAMVSGPTLSDIEQGCEVPIDPDVTVCPSGQLGCNSHNAVSSWTLGPDYTDALSGVRAWTGDSSGDSGTCQRRNGDTSPAANAAWKAMSIVDGTVATFSYPKTQITSWLCSNAEGAVEGSTDGVMNNSSTQAQLFFGNFTLSSQIPQGLIINGVTSCEGTEGVAGGAPPSNYSGSGMDAIKFDMVTDTANKCVAH